MGPEDSSIDDLLDSIDWGGSGGYSPLTSQRSNVLSQMVTTIMPTPPEADFGQAVADGLRAKLQERDGECFRTEIRDSGVFICGIHQSSIWTDEDGPCAAMEELLELLIGVIHREVAKRSAAAAQAEAKAAIAQPQGAVPAVGGFGSGLNQEVIDKLRSVKPWIPRDFRADRAHPLIFLDSKRSPSSG